ncbi:MAG: anhydro-N-acetylmuramic acid kinase [Bacteroidota bacterium]
MRCERRRRWTCGRREGELNSYVIVRNRGQLKQAQPQKSKINNPQSTKLIIGLMSGTSLDGIDAVLLRVKGSGAATSFKQLAYIERPYPRGLKEVILRNSRPDTSSVDDIARLNMLLAELYADAVKRVARKARIPLSRIDLIGSHGQTIRHLPKPVKMFGKNIRATLQIGDPSVLATLTGITTVGNFRVADVAVGGQGAPLVPYFDWLTFRSRTKNRILLNIGGIANMTLLPKDCMPDDVIAFDTGPGNMMLDALMQHFYRLPFDKNGKIASKGMIILELLRWMKSHSYLKRKPPKSTGREEFGKEFVGRLLKRAWQYDKGDVVATVAQFTAFAVHDSYVRFGRKMKVDELIVSGGGARNVYLMLALQEYFKGTVVKSADQFGVSSDAKEAICFAILANETLAGNPANLPSVTGAQRKVVLGVVAHPRK